MLWAYLQRDRIAELVGIEDSGLIFELLTFGLGLTAVGVGIWVYRALRRLFRAGLRRWLDPQAPAGS